MELWEKVIVALLIIGIIGVIVIGSLYAFVKGKTGPVGQKGKSGDQGTSLPTITSSLAQVNTSNFPQSQTIVSQYTKTITINASGSLLNIPIGSTIQLGVIPSAISPPSVFPASGIAFFDNINPVSVVVSTQGNVSIGPTVAANIYSFSLVYSIP
jgi:hypothetical protein